MYCNKGHSQIEIIVSRNLQRSPTDRRAAQFGAPCMLATGGCYPLSLAMLQLKAYTDT